MSAQLPLAVRWPQSADLGEFVPGPNHEALAALRHALAGRMPNALVFDAPRGRGKSMLLQGATLEVTRRGGTAAYLPLGLARGEVAGALQGLEDHEWVGLDELEQAAGDLPLCAAIARFIDRRRLTGRALVLALAGTAGLSADLQTRLQACARFPLHALRDADLVEVLRRRALARALDMTEEVAWFIVRRQPRELPVLLALLDGLDRASLSAQRRLTIPFVQQWCAARDGASARTGSAP